MMRVHYSCSLNMTLSQILHEIGFKMLLVYKAPNCLPRSTLLEMLLSFEPNNSQVMLHLFSFSPSFEFW